MSSPPFDLSKRQLLAIVLGFSAVRLAIAPAYELFPQEAYYDFYAQHLALSYFDHPPLIGWLLRCFTAILGNHVFVLRFCAFCLTGVTQLLLWKLVQEAVPADRQVPALLFLITPLMSVVSLVSSPDVPVMLFSTAAMLCLWRAFHGPEQRRWLAWLAAGVTTGLGFDSKYTAGFLMLGAFLLLLDPLHRRQLRSPWPYLAAVVAVVCTAPVLIWNAQHGFVSLRLQTTRRFNLISGIHPHYFGSLLTTQTALLGVLFLVFLWEALRLPWRLRTIPPERRPATLFFAAFSVPPILAFVAYAFCTYVKPNWLYPFYLAGIPFIALSWEKPKRLVAPTLGWSVIVQALAAVELLFAVVPIHSDACFGWRELAAAVAPLRTPDEFVFSADGYKTTAELDFYGGQKVYAGNLIGRLGFEFEYLGDDPQSLRGRDALFIKSDTEMNDDGPERQPPVGLEAHFASIYQLEPLVVRRHGRIVHKFWFWHCHDYKGTVGEGSARAFRPIGDLP